MMISSKELSHRSSAVAAEFTKRGFAHLKGALDGDRVKKWASLVYAQIEHLDSRTLDSDCVRVGPERYLLPLRIEGGINDSELYGAESILVLLRHCLGDDMILNSASVVVAYPGAEVQQAHRDHTALFETETDAPLPCYAVTVAVPLVDLDQRTGTTEVWENSQGMAASPATPGVLAYAERGDVLLVDYRLWHRGTPNRSAIPRPIMYLVYSRPWFSDARNFYKFAPVQISDEELGRVSRDCRALFFRQVGGRLG